MYSNSNNDGNDILAAIFAVILMLAMLIGWIISLFTEPDYTKEREAAMQEVGKYALAEQSDASGRFMEEVINARFEQGEDKNTAHIECGEFTTVRYDVNKSRLVGKYISKKTMEVIGGFKDESVEPSKHGTGIDPPEEKKKGWIGKLFKKDKTENN